MLNELFARCDRLDAETEAWEARRAQQQQQPKKRAADPGRLVYKTVYTEPRPQVMDAEGSARWNAWFAASFEHCVERSEALVERVVQAGGVAISLAREERERELEKMRAEIAALRAEVEILRAHTAKADTSQANGTRIARSDVH